MTVRRRIDLGGRDWQIGAVGAGEAGSLESRDIERVEQWFPATVPGDIRDDLLRAGRVPDPYVGLDNERSRWVDERDWWYRKEFSLALPEGERAFLIFGGIDYLAAIYLDGELLNFHEGMFSRQIYEVTHLLHRSPEHVLTLRLVGSSYLPRPELRWAERAWDRITKWLPWVGNAFPDRFSLVKLQMGFGWDFAAHLRTIGIWDDVHLVVVRSVLIQDLQVKTSLRGSQATVDVDVTLDSAEAQRATLEIEVCDQGAAVARHSVDVELPAGPGRCTTSLTVDDPTLWQPWDRGTPHLYDLSLTISRNASGQRVALDGQTIRLGIRDIVLRRPPAATPSTEPWLFYVNGQREFIRGANWVPLDAMPGRLRPADYADMLEQVRAAGINLLRVWGGGLREKAAFYDLCDEKGILVWQEFPFACAFLGYYPCRTHFMNVARQEATDIVRQLRNHPSLVLWCGGNEFGPWRNRSLVEMLRDVVAEGDGTRPFKRVSPDRGEVHNWRIWHGKASVAYFRRDRSSFLTEFGLQAVPALDSLRKFISAEGLWPPGREWVYHGAQLGKLFFYIRPWLPPLTESLDRLFKGEGLRLLDEIIAASQQAQAHGLQVAIEHMRRRKGEAGGVAFWQLNEPWPAISWSVIDYYRQPKAAYHKVTQVYNPVLLSVLYPFKSYRAREALPLEIWAINDLLEPIEQTRAEVTLDGQRLFAQTLSLPADSSALVARLTHPLTQPPRHLSTRLLTPEGRVLSANDYELTYRPGRERYFPDHIFHWFSEWLLKW